MAIYDLYIEESMGAEETAGRVIDLSIEESFGSLESSQDGGKSLLELIALAESVTASSGKSLNELLGMVESLDRQVDFNRSIEETAQVQEYVSGLLFRNGFIVLPGEEGSEMTCPTPITDHIKLELNADPLTFIELKLPEFGDSHGTETSIITNKDIYIRRNLYGSQLSMNFTGVIDKSGMIDFYRSCRGILIKLTDQYENEFVGFLTNPRVSAKTIFESKCQEDEVTDWNDYGFEFIFEGKRTLDGDL